MIRILAMAEEEKEWLTTTQAAIVMDITPQAVQNLCRRGAIECRRFGHYWQVNKSDAENYEKSVGGRGNKLPPKSA